MKMHQLDMLFILARAKNQTYRSVFAFGHIILLKPAKVQFHLTLILRLELTKLKIDRYKTAQAAMVEQQIDIIIFAVDGYTLLTRQESKIIAKFGNKFLKFGNDGTFKVLFRKIALQT